MRTLSFGTIWKIAEGVKDMSVKKYPFNAEKHAHDIEFRRNRAYNERSDKQYNGTLTAEEDEQYTALIDALDELSLIFLYRDYRGIVWLTGKEYGLARECVGWAESMRG